MTNYNRYYDQHSSKDYYEYNLWENSHFNNGFHLQTSKGEASEPIEVLDSSEDELSGGEAGKRSDKIDCVPSLKRIITRARMLSDTDMYCRMYLSCDDDCINLVPPEHQADHNTLGTDWTNTWSKGGEKPHATSIPSYNSAFTENKQNDNKMASAYSNKYFTEGTMAPNYSNMKISCAENNQMDTTATPFMSPSKEKKDKCVGKIKYKENSVQKMISKALAKPITISKATSMMQRMGWKGGPLGKHGDGIVEPIAPDATYITKKGFGIEDRLENDRKGETNKREPKVPQTKKAKKIKLSGKSKNVHKKGKLPKGMAKEKKDLVTTNSLIEILEFVRNNREIEVSFDNKLTGMERKVIHNTVQFIIDDDQELETIDYENKYHIKLLQLIYESNHFNLVTESKGERKQRQLTLYKEAKDCTYLVTPDDLLPQDPDDFTDEIIVIDDTNVYNDTDIVSHAKVSESDTFVTENKCKEPDKSIRNDNESVQNDNESVQTDSKSIQNDNESIQNDNESIQTSSTSKQVNDNSNPFLKSIERIQNTIQNEKPYTGEKQAGNCIEESMQVDIDINKSITDILKEYILEFLNDNIYTEFRFLGPFTDEQTDKINWCINNLYNCIYNGKSAECFEHILEKINEEDEYYFEVKEDSNGSVVMYKWKTEDLE